MATTATSSSTSANTASQRNNQNTDSAIRTRHVLGSVIRSSSVHSDLLQPPSRLSPLPSRSSPQLSNHPYSRTPGKNGSDPIGAPPPLPSCEYDYFLFCLSPKSAQYILIAFRRTYNFVRARMWLATNRDVFFFLFFYHFENSLPAQQNMDHSQNDTLL